MYNNMQDFGSGPGGGMMSGKWINKSNGTTINVRDCVMQGDEMIVLTDRGQISGEDFSRNYIQMSDEEYDMKGSVINSSSPQQPKNTPVQAPQAPQTPSAPLKMFDDIEDPAFIAKQNQPLYKEESESTKLIKKLFTKTETKPEITVDIKWADFPKNELNMLMNVFDVSKEDIADYLRTYLDDEEIKISIKKFIEKML